MDVGLQITIKPGSDLDLRRLLVQRRMRPPPRPTPTSNMGTHLCVGPGVLELLTDPTGGKHGPSTPIWMRIGDDPITPNRPPGHHSAHLPSPSHHPKHTRRLPPLSRHPQNPPTNPPVQNLSTFPRQSKANLRLQKINQAPDRMVNEDSLGKGLVAMEQGLSWDLETKLPVGKNRGRLRRLRISCRE